MIHYMWHFMSHHLIYLSILSRWIILISYSESCAFSSIILHKQFCECQITCWQQTHMWLSYRCIFLLCHMIGERAHIHLLYFSEFWDLISTLVDPINLSWEQTTKEFLKNLLVFMYVHYLVCTSFGWPDYLCQQ